MWTILKFFVINMCLGAAEYCSESKVVTIDQGRLRGFRYLDGNYFAFMSVPYATAPPGKYRFKSPLPPPVWMQTFDAFETGQVCPQSLYLPKIREDCLIANIFVPDTNATNLPVMVHVHGGAFVVTSGDYFRYTKLVDSRKTIVVTFNYRLGVHGFLCLGTNDVPGNAGMKDQVALLRWVQRNIASFEGNPNDVTLVGCSAGGSAVDVLSLSPMATGLFHKAIIESGSCLGTNGIQIDPISNAKTYARLLNFTDVENITALEEFYKTASYELLTSQTDEIIHRPNGVTLFSPCVERDVGQEMFLSESPVDILKKGNYPKLPIMYGFSESEGLNSILSFEQYHEKMNKNFADFLPGDLQFDSREEKEKVAHAVKTLYYGDKPVSKETIINYVNYFSDVLFVFPMLRSLELRQKFGNNTAYLFEYSFVDEHTENIPFTNERKAGHCSHFDVIMDQDFINNTKEHLAMQKIMREVWLNFITTGRPVPEKSSLPAWPPVGDNWSPYMVFSNATLKLKTSLYLEERAKFWNMIYTKYHGDHKAPSNAIGFNYKTLRSNITFILLLYIIL